MAEGEKPTDEGTIWVSSLVSNKTKLPLVQIEWGDKKCQMTPEEARGHARIILECAEAAEVDAFLYDFFENEVGAKDHGYKAVHAFREYRKKHTMHVVDAQQKSETVSPDKK
jgi:hypothetical protein